MPNAARLHSAAKLVAVDAKLQCCEALLLHVTALDGLTPDDPVLVRKDLEEFALHLDILQNDLSKKLTFVKEVHIAPIDDSSVTAPPATSLLTW